jgi:D-glycerate 3-kinase
MSAMPPTPDFSPLHRPVHQFCLERIRAGAHRPLVIGVQAPQGAGKTTLVTHLLDSLPGHGLRGAGVSIDDFYLTRAEQIAVAEAHPGNPCMEHRGYPGTHDVDLGTRTLAALRQLSTDATTRVPVYDKSAHGGRGDRLPVEEWRLVQGPLDVVLVEGWMLGFSPVATDHLPSDDLVPANAALARYGAWYEQIDIWIVLRAAEAEFVVDWRIEAEERMKATGKPGLSREAIEDYVRRFLPAYRTWADGTAAGRTPDFTLTIGKDRKPIS